MKCVVCDKALEPVSGKGRPRVYCGDNCRDMAKYFEAYGRKFDLIKWSSLDALSRHFGECLSRLNQARNPLKKRAQK